MTRLDYENRVKILLMKSCSFWFWIFSESALFWLLASYPIRAQQAEPIVPDTTLPVTTNVTTSGNQSIITGGTQAGTNLFHSFQNFSVPTGQEAFFNNAVEIQNIINRVTGSSRSEIDGLIRNNAPANLFLINPNGIIFGPNARLQIGGSFVASTADSLKFPDGREFSATNPQTSPLLTVSVPLGLQFGSNPREIVMDRSILRVPDGKTLGLVGSNVSFAGGNLIALDGRIDIGSVGTSLVNLIEIPQGYAFEYSGVQNFQDIQLSGTQVNVGGLGGGGSIQVQGRNINLTNGALIVSVTRGAGIGGDLTVDAAEKLTVAGGANIATVNQGSGQAGNLLVKATDVEITDGANIATVNQGSGQAGNLLVKASNTVELIGTAANGRSPSGLSAQVRSTGRGGNLTIETGRLTIRNGAAVDASTFGAGRAGDVMVKATDVELVGVARTPIGTFPSGIFAQVGEGAIENAGNAGNVTIYTQRLTADGGAQISTAARQRGNGGNLTIDASDSIRLSGALPDATQLQGSSGIFVPAEPGARGNAGNLEIKTGLLTVENGAKISANNRGSGQGGTLTLDVKQLMIRDGGLVKSDSFASGPGGTLTVKNAESVSVIGRGTLGSTPVNSTLSAASQSSGKAGDLNITTSKLNVQDEGQVSVSGRGSGAAGNLTVTAKEISLNRGKLTAETNAGDGADIKLKIEDLLLMENQSLISAQAFNDANGGNVKIEAPNGFVVAAINQNNDIVASAVQGQGGEIDITAYGIFGIEEGRAILGNITNDIDASSEFGLAGRVNITRPDVEPVGVLLELPTAIVDASTIVDTGCAAFANSEDSTFFITGRGGLPSNPNDPLSPDVVWSDTRLPATTLQQERSQKPASTPQSNSNVVKIVPATGWVFNGKGEVTLISHASGTTGLGSTAATCPQR
ncbi:MAG: filamentous hemagglutinin N-terminal domain-containing protein [Scytonema sp. PMC 1069.18]|nr:filamentous hemagglutinin N-terminal domain-containing protein [Scytonema sp. PMC 1069.18]MEC4886611.1 filamentous hemagglutinin N-terminal domain-containing protein [Scytonema sp. PMC 1070.18]